ncbi:MAG: hypothetical protein JXQ87_04465 [Bacteroidia bacterium]
MILKILAAPLLLYRVFFKKWADWQELKFQGEISKRLPIDKTAHFFPELPNKRAAIRNALQFMGYKFEIGWKANSVNFAWHDETIKQLESSNVNAFNIKCNNISKSFLDQIHLEVFGYGLTVNPLQAKGKILEKSEQNGKHDAKIIKAPCHAKSGYVYQKIIDTRKTLFYEDIRPVVIGSEILMVYLNYRLAGKRFSAKKIKATLAKAADHLSDNEQKQIIELCSKMGADIAELDILRDRHNGKIYVVDINPTAFGPAHGLSLNEKLNAIRIYSEGLEKQINLTKGNS